MLESLSVLHAEVVTFLCTQDQPNSFPSPLSPDLDKGMTVVPLHKVLKAVKQLRWKAPTGADAGEGAGNLVPHQRKGLGQGGELCMKKQISL